MAKIKNKLVNFFKTPYEPRMIVLAVIVGIIGGLGAVLFHYLILLFKYIFYGATSTDTFLDTVRMLPWYHRLLAPAIGGLIVGPLVTYIVQEARGHGVPEVIEALVFKKGTIRFRVAPLKALISAICIGSGGSAGREGPIVQIGASFGSSLGNYLELSPEKVKTLLGAGAAAGIAGTFNAPLAGVVFSMEVLLKKFELSNFSPLVVAAVTGTAVANILFGDAEPIFMIPEHQLVNYIELIFYMGLGILGGVIAIIYGNSLYSMEHLFEKIPVPEASKAAIGGLLLGVLALVVPQIYATGYPVMESALYGQLSLQMVLLLVVAKILATILTLGSGGSGGIFAPSLYIGAMLGSAYGMIVHSAFPAITAGASSYAMVGMGTVFAGATHAPLTAIIIIFEMTHDPLIILPLMFACKFSSFIAKQFQEKNIYSTKLLNRGIDIETIEGRNVLGTVKAKEIMTKNVTTVTRDTTVIEAKQLFEKTLFNYIPVVNKETDELLGVLNFNDLMGHLDLDCDGPCHVEDIMITPFIKISEEKSLLKALKLIEENEVDLVPIVSEDNPDELVGLLTKSDILKAYHHWELA